MNRTLVLPLALVALANVAHAEECPTFRLDTPGSALSKIPLYDQEGVDEIDGDICYAASGAVIADYHRLTNSRDRVTKFTAPMSLAAGHQGENYNPRFKFYRDQLPQERTNSKILGNGILEQAIRDRQGAEVCDQNFLAFYDGLSAKRDTLKATPAQFLEAVFRNIEKFKAATTEAERADRHMMLQDRINIGDPMFTLDPYFGCRIGRDASSARKILAATYASSQESYKEKALQTFLENFCKGRDFVFKVPNPESQHRRQFPLATRNREMRRLMSDLLMGSARYKKPRPVALGYCGSIVRPGFNARLIDNANGSVTKQDDCGPHSGVLIGQGRHPKTNKCAFLVRSGYGNRCAPREVRLRDDVACDTKSGAAWLDADELAQATFATTVIPDK